MPIASSPISSSPIATSPGTSVVVWAGNLPPQENIFFLDQVSVTFYTSTDVFGFQFNEEQLVSASVFGATYLAIVNGLVIFTNPQQIVVLTLTGVSGQIHVKKLSFTKFAPAARTNVPLQETLYAVPISDSSFLVYLPSDVVSSTPSVGTYSNSVLTVPLPAPIEVTFQCTTIYGETLSLPVKISVWGM